MVKGRLEGMSMPGVDTASPARHPLMVAAAILALVTSLAGCFSAGTGGGHHRRPHGPAQAGNHPATHRPARRGPGRPPVVMPAESPLCHPGLNAAEFWLIGYRELRALSGIAPGVVRRAIKAQTLFVLGPPHQSSRTGQAVAVFKSYALFSRELSTIPPATHWVLYDNEHWAQTPVTEQRHPVRYETLFANLAHRHGFRVILTPGQDLAKVRTGHGSRQVSGNAVWQRYLAMRLPAVSARLADIYEIQAQADELPQFRAAGTYLRVVRAAAGQARAANPGAVIFAGISTNRVTSAPEMFHDFMAARKLVAGYWLNIPHYRYLGQPLLAGQFLRKLPAVTGAAGRTCARGMTVP
jgi:hypothetical protein